LKSEEQRKDTTFSPTQKGSDNIADLLGEGYAVTFYITLILSRLDIHKFGYESILDAHKYAQRMYNKDTTDR
jgi:hypothetical protein